MVIIPCSKTLRKDTYMGRGTLPSYTRISHVPNLLEGYRYLSRKNLTLMSVELGMSYHTIRRLCTAYSTPQKRTMDKITEALPFITEVHWKLWKEYCEQALFAEKQGDISALLTIEDKLRAMMPEDEIVAPLHIISECSIAAAEKLHTDSTGSKTCSFYLSDLHHEAMNLMSIKKGTTKSDLLRQFIDAALADNPDVLETLIRISTGKPVQIEVPKKIEPQEELLDIIEVNSKEELSKLVPNVPVEEVIEQLTADLPEELPLEENLLEPVDTTEPFMSNIDYSSEDYKLEIEEWKPMVSAMTESSNLTEEELAELFSGES